MRVVAHCVTALLCIGCSAPAPKPSPVPGPTPGVIERTFRPSALDPSANRWDENQYTYIDPRAPRLGKLVVYLVGASSKPSSGRAMMKELAAMGLPALAPAYANDWGVGKCSPEREPDETCHGKARLEAFEGIDHSTYVDVSPPNAAEPRVARLLARLAQEHPGEGWGAFLNGDKPRWDQIVVAGHSHGASSAGLVSKVRLVHRAVMLSGPYDNRAGTPAPWTRDQAVTPADRLWAFSHTAEPQHAGHLADWDAMGVPGAPTNVDAGAIPFGGSHRLVTSLPAAAGKDAHSVTAAGAASPRNADGSYVLGPVWRHLFGI